MNSHFTQLKYAYFGNKQDQHQHQVVVNYQTIRVMDIVMMLTMWQNVIMILVTVVLILFKQSFVISAFVLPITLHTLLHQTVQPLELALVNMKIKYII